MGSDLTISGAGNGLTNGLTNRAFRSGKSLRARRLALAEQDNAPWRAASERIGVYGDAARRILRGWRNDSEWNQSQAAEEIATRIAPGRTGWMLSTDSVSRWERDASRVLSMTLEELIAARLAFGRSLAEWGQAMEGAVRTWERERQMTHMAAHGADVRSLARQQVMDELAADITQALPRLTADELRLVATTVEGLARAHGPAGHRTAADALDDFRAETRHLLDETPPPILPSSGETGA